MQIVELIFFVAILLLLLDVVFGKVHGKISRPQLVYIAYFIVCIGLVFEGFRWQLIPSYAVLLLVSLSLLIPYRFHVFWRTLAVIPLTILLGASAFLAVNFPIFDFPGPTGPYAIGTSGYNATDETRSERFSPELNRELYVRVWYPASDEGLDSYRRSRLWEDLYSREYDLISFFTAYLGKIRTNSHWQAPASDQGPFPVLVFNHGMNSFPEQNTALVEHLVSSGYVVFSIAHTYQSTKVYTSNAGKVLFSNSLPPDFPAENFGSRFGVISQAAQDSGAERSLLFQELFTFFDTLGTLEDEEAQRAFISEIFSNRDQYRFGRGATEDALYNHIGGYMTIMSSMAETWTEDIQFVVDDLSSREFTVADLGSSLNLESLGVMGHSFGSSAAGEFCKLDHRCKAGVHLDGNYSGYSWNAPSLAPMLVMYSWNAFEMNDFAYIGTSNDLWNLSYAGLEHLDFTDMALVIPSLRLPNALGEIDESLAIDFVNDSVLGFLDQYLKGLSPDTSLEARYPQIIQKRYGAVAD